MVAALPAALKGKQLRHLFVDGLRANRTRTNATRYGLTWIPNATEMGYAAAETSDLSGWQNNPRQATSSSCTRLWGRTGARPAAPSLVSPATPS